MEADRSHFKLHKADLAKQEFGTGQGIGSIFKQTNKQKLDLTM